MAVPNDVMAIVLGGEVVVGGASVSGSVLPGAINIINYYTVVSSGALVLVLLVVTISVSMHGLTC